MKNVLFFRYWLLILVMFSVTGCEPQLTTQWDGKVAGKFHQGDGTAENPWQVSSTQELAYLARKVNKGKDFEGEFFRLTANLDLMGDQIAEGWTPIGEQGEFNGVFDGEGRCIDHVYTVLKDADRPLGLFGSIGTSGKVQNLCVNNCVHEKITKETGVIAGINAGSIESCEVNGKIMATGGIVGKNVGNITSCHMDGNLTVFYLDRKLNEKQLEFNNTGGVIPIGGIAGYNSGKIHYCLFQGQLSTFHLWGDAGGICYENAGEIRECAAMGIIAGGRSFKQCSGGIAAISSGNIIDCYSNGMYYRSETSPYTSPIVAKVEGDYSIRNCYTTSELSDYACIIGNQSEPDPRVVNCYIYNGCYYSHKIPSVNIKRLGARLPEEMQTAAFARTLGNVWEEDAEGVNKGYPILKNLCYAEAMEEVTDDIEPISENLKDLVLAIYFNEDLKACKVKYGLTIFQPYTTLCYKQKLGRGIELYQYLSIQGNNKWVIPGNIKPDGYQFTVVFSDSSYPFKLKEQLREKLNMQDDLYQKIGGSLVSLIEDGEEGNSLTIKVEKE